MITGIQRIHYVVDTVLNYYDAQLVRGVGLVPMVGPLIAAPGPDGGAGDTSPAVAAATIHVLGRWRKRVVKFHKWGLVSADPGQPVEKSRAWALYNCQPAFAVCAPRTKVLCHTRALCPFCAGRAALPIWKAIDARLFPPPGSGLVRPARPSGSVLPRALVLEGGPEPDLESLVPKLAGTTMLSRVITYTVPLQRNDRVQLPGFINSRLNRAIPAAVREKRRRQRRRVTDLPSRHNELARLKALGVEGGLDTIHIALKHRHAGPKAVVTGWLVEMRQLMFLPTARFDEVVRNPAVTGSPTHLFAHTGAVLEHWHDPTRRDVLREVALSLRHSRVPLFGARRHVETYLAAREGHRMSTTFGSLYGAAGTRSLSP